MKTFLFGLNISPPKTTQCTFNFEVQFNFAHDGFLIQNNWIHQEAPIWYIEVVLAEMMSVWLRAWDFFP